MNIHAVIPASGLSSRMGTCKSLLNIGKRSLLAYQVQFLRSVGIENIHVAVNDNKALLAEASRLKVNTVVPEKPSNSMLETIRITIRKLPQSCSVIMVMPSDHPPLNQDLFLRLLNECETHLNKIVVPTFNNKRGHPICIPRIFFEDILTSFDDTGIRGLYHKYPNSIQSVDCSNDSIHLNLNTQNDLQSFKSRYSKL